MEKAGLIDANMNAANWPLLMGDCYSASAWLESNTRRKVLRSTHWRTCRFSTSSEPREHLSA